MLQNLYRFVDVFAEDALSSVSRIFESLGAKRTDVSVCVQIESEDVCDKIIIIIYLLTAIGLPPGGSGYFTCKQNMKSVTTRFKYGGLHEKHVVTTWNVGNRLSICL